MTSPIEAAQQRLAVSPQKAREQSAEFHGFAASVDIQIGNEVFEIPNPSLLDDDQQERYNDLNAEIEATCDREEDITIPEFTTPDGVVIPAKTERGELKRPYTINEVPMKPAYNTRLAKVLFGEDRYQTFKNGGGRSNQIALIWGQMEREYEERKKKDPKSVGGAEAPATVLNGNSVGLVAVPSPPHSGVVAGTDEQS